MTGVSIHTRELLPKRLDLLSEVVPEAKVVALLVNPNNASVEPVIRGVQEAASAKRVHLHILDAGTESEIDAAFPTLIQLHAGGVIVGPDTFFTSRRDQLVALASRHAIPAIYCPREFVDAGGLISYGPSLTDAYRRAGNYVGKVLKGAKPADLPVEQPTTFELVINLNTPRRSACQCRDSSSAAPTRSSNDAFANCSCTAARLTRSGASENGIAISYEAAAIRAAADPEVIGFGERDAG